MTYELAKKLKEAGFPHVRISSEKIWIGGDWTSPTLSELIEACGDDFAKLWKEKDGRWFSKMYVMRHGIPRKSFFSEGSTAEEAVANMWLESKK